MADDDSALLEQAKALPFGERLTHKHWKARNEAYLEVTKEAVWAENANADLLKEFGAFPRQGSLLDLQHHYFVLSGASDRPECKRADCSKVHCSGTFVSGAAHRTQCHSVTLYLK